MINTCPIDNWSMIFQSLTISGRIALDDLTKAGDLIKTALQLVSWHCARLRTTSPRLFSCFKNFAIFSVDLLSRRCNLKCHDLPTTIDMIYTYMYLFVYKLSNMLQSFLGS